MNGLGIIDWRHDLSSSVSGRHHAVKLHGFQQLFGWSPCAVQLIASWSSRSITDCTGMSVIASPPYSCAVITPPNVTFGWNFSAGVGPKRVSSGASAAPNIWLTPLSLASAAVKRRGGAMGRGGGE